MKRRFRNIFTLAFAAMLALACEDKVDKNVTWPEWASRPIIGLVELVAADGDASIVAGSTVRILADVEDQFNPLSEYAIKVIYSGKTVYEEKAEISGNTLALDKELTLPFAPGLSGEGIYPEVSLTVKNVVNGTATTWIKKEDNLLVTRPSLPASLFLVDNNGTVVELKKTKGYNYESEAGAELSIGTSFRIVEKLSGSAIDPAGIVWGAVDGDICTGDADVPAIATPSTDGKGFKTIGFDTYDFKVRKLINHTVTLNKMELGQIEQSGVQYYALERVSLPADCEVVFDGFGDLKSMLQPDRFEILSENTAKYTGNTGNWSFFYDVQDHWMILNNSDMHAAGQLWVTGEKACFPLGNEDTENSLKYIEGDGKVRYATLSLPKDEKGVFYILLYLKKDYVLNFYSGLAWAKIVEVSVSDTKYAVVTENNGQMTGVRPGTDFIPGVYMIRAEVVTPPSSDGTGAEISLELEPYTL